MKPEIASGRKLKAAFLPTFISPQNPGPSGMKKHLFRKRREKKAQEKEWASYPAPAPEEFRSGSDLCPALSFGQSIFAVVFPFACFLASGVGGKTGWNVFRNLDSWTTRQPRDKEPFPPFFLFLWAILGIWYARGWSSKRDVYLNVFIDRIGTMPPSMAAKSFFMK